MVRKKSEAARHPSPIKSNVSKGVKAARGKEEADDSVDAGVEGRRSSAVEFLNSLYADDAIVEGSRRSELDSNESVSTHEIESEEENAVDGKELEIDEEDDAVVAEDDDLDDVNDAEGQNDHILEQEFGNDNSGDEATDNDSGDDCWDEEMIPDPYSSGDDDEIEERQRENIDPEADLVLGRCFASAEEFKLCLLRYTIKTRYNIKFYKSTSLRLAAKCASERKDKEKRLEPCPWRVYCAYERSKRKLMIKVLVGTHTCIRSKHCKLFKRGNIAYLFTERLRVNPKMTPKEMAAEIDREYGFLVSEDVCATAKTLVMKRFRKTHEDHFAKIWDYQAEIYRSNPGTAFEIETIPGHKIGSKQRFYRAFICFAAQRESWKKTCRPIIGVDGAFLKWNIKGQLLAAVGRDGDNRIVPIAWAVVEVENEDNWTWFIRLLSRDLGLSDGRDIAMVSDKCKGLVKAIHEILPLAEHRQCCKHMIYNWKRDSHDLRLQRFFWKIARSYTTGDYWFNMGELRKYSQVAYDTLLLTRPDTWSRAFFKIGSMCNDNTNNLCESFNRTIREARRKPVLDLLEDVRLQSMVRNAKRSIVANRQQTEFTKRAHAEIELMENKSRNCKRHMAVGPVNEVHHEGERYSVDMELKTCGCKKWQMTGIPCIHACCVILDKNHRIEDYVSPMYTIDTWRKTYSLGIQPVQGQRLWPITNKLPVLPPPARGNVGRPKNHARKKAAHEKNSTATKLSRDNRVMTCSNCKAEGHNKTTCKNGFVEPPAKRPRGRPRNYQGQTSQGGQVQTSQMQTSQDQSSQYQGSSQFQGNSQYQASQTSHEQEAHLRGHLGRWFGL